MTEMGFDNTTQTVRHDSFSSTYIDTRKAGVRTARWNRYQRTLDVRKHGELQKLKNKKEKKKGKEGKREESWLEDFRAQGKRE